MPPLRQIVIDGVRTTWREAGDGPVVVLVHGSPGASSVFGASLAALADAGFRAIAPDLPGSGASDKPPAGLDHVGVARRLAPFLDTVAGARFALVAHGRGAALALAAARPTALRCVALVDATVRVGFVPSLPRRILTAGAVGELLGVGVNAVGRLLVLRGDPGSVEVRSALAAKGARRTLLRLARNEGWSAVASAAEACLSERRPPVLLLWGPGTRCDAAERRATRELLPWAEEAILPIAPGLLGGAPGAVPPVLSGFLAGRREHR